MRNSLSDKADNLATSYCQRTFKRPTATHFTVVKNALLDCLFAAPEPDFIARVSRDRFVGEDARPILRRLAKDLLPLAGELVQELQA